MTLPSALRNRLAGLALGAFHDAEARKGLKALAALRGAGGGFEGARSLPARLPEDLLERHAGALRLKLAWRQHAGEVAERSRRALRLVEGRPLDPEEAPRDTALAQAALLFDARLFFEVHELLEPYWIRAEGGEREALQGLIQVAVGFHHLGNGNVTGARGLVHDGIGKLLDRELERLPLDAFARALIGLLDEINRLGADAPERLDWQAVPRFPARGQAAGRDIDFGKGGAG